MSVIRWNPIREIDELFARAGHPAARRAVAPAEGHRFTPLADISESSAGYRIELELPGFSAADVDVSLHDGVLRVAGEAPTRQQVDSAEADPADNSASDTEPDWQLKRSERGLGGFERRFRLPEDADSEAVSATARDGVLTLIIDRLAERAPRAIEVKVA